MQLDLKSSEGENSNDDIVPYTHKDLTANDKTHLTALVTKIFANYIGKGFLTASKLHIISHRFLQSLSISKDLLQTTEYNCQDFYNCCAIRVEFNKSTTLINRQGRRSYDTKVFFSQESEGGDWNPIIKKKESKEDIFYTYEYLKDKMDPKRRHIILLTRNNTSYTITKDSRGSWVMRANDSKILNTVRQKAPYDFYLYDDDGKRYGHYKDGVYGTMKGGRIPRKQRSKKKRRFQRKMTMQKRKF